MSAIRRLVVLALLSSPGLGSLAPAHAQIVAMPLSSAAESEDEIPMREPIAMPEGRLADGSAAGCPWYWQGLPVGRVFPAYLAGERESRMSGVIVHEEHFGWITDDTLGARVGLLRYGTDNVFKPEGWQLDFEAAAFPRLSLENMELISSDFRYGVPLTYRSGQIEAKFAFYHLSSHLSDLYLLEGNPSVFYSRNTLVWALGWRPIDALRIYGEVGWAFHNCGPSQPWEFQFGVEYSSLEQSDSGGSPFAALNAHLREEVDFVGDLTVQAGWQWRNQIGQLLRVGLQFLTGKSDQYQFQARNEQQLGAGLWYDF
jgi:hypothetical protein